MLVLLGRGELSHELAALGAFHDQHGLMLEIGSLEQLTWETLGIDDYGSEYVRHNLIRLLLRGL
jgi:hypothetical protein